MEITIKEMQRACGEFRKCGLCKSQAQIADELHVTRYLISKFEHGKTFSGRVLAYYVLHGFNLAWARWYNDRD